MLCRSHGRPGEIGRRLSTRTGANQQLTLAAWLAAACAPNIAAAAPGVANRLGGANAQGPATSSVTAIYHNPAMLGSVPGFSFETTLRTGVDHLSVRRFDIEPADGSPTSGLRKPIHLANPAFDYFVGASFMLDPVAIGAAVHTFGSRFRINSDDDQLAYHLASESDFGCTLDRSRICPNQRKGGMLEMRTDFDLALAWNALDFMRLGATAHFPRQRTYLARDVDSVLTGAGGCDPMSAVESPECAERLSFRGSTRLRWFGLNRRPSTRLDFALTVGVAFDVGERVTIGFRYRTQPLLDGGNITLNGAAAVCRPDRAGPDAQSELTSCESAEAIDATVSERLPQEVAVGVAGEFGKWALDSNLYWIDRCPLGGVGDCGGNDARELVLVGLDQDASTLPQTTLYRGLQDVFGAELWARYRLDDVIGANLPYYKVLCSGGSEGVDPETGKQLRCVPRVDLLLGGGVNSPAVQPGAVSVTNSDGWTLLATLGASFNLPGRNGTWSLAPAYSLDFMLPTRVGPGGHTPAFDPTAALAFEASGADLNSASANAVLAGRGLPTNAGIYTSAVHTILFSVRWSERGLGARELPKNRR
jgi:opacity protein-like surface antigen